MIDDEMIRPWRCELRFIAPLFLPQCTYPTFLLRRFPAANYFVTQSIHPSVTQSRLVGREHNPRGVGDGNGCLCRV